MRLIDIELGNERIALPADARALLREASRRIRSFQREHRAPGFIPCDFRRAYRAMQALTTAELVPGDQFCEWGSGFGVVTCLAAMLGFNACGIEIDANLVDAARSLAEDFDLEVEFVRGSFLPCRAEDSDAQCFAWLTTSEESAYPELGLAPDEFDLIFAYPWPDEEAITEASFASHAADGSVLLTYHASDEFRCRRKWNPPVADAPGSPLLFFS